MIKTFFNLTDKPLFQLSLLSWECAMYGVSVAQGLLAYAIIHGLCATVWFYLLRRKFKV